jgi:hypothetical protein
MNTANLQIEGLLLAVAALTETLRAKGLIDTDELAAALDAAEAGATAAGRSGELSPANRDAVAFPIRFLRQAAAREPGSGPAGFSEIAARVGQAKPGA